MSRNILNKCSTAQILEIVETFGGDDKQKLMRSLKSLRYEVRYEAFKAFRKRLLPLMTFEQFKNLK